MAGAQHSAGMGGWLHRWTLNTGTIGYTEAQGCIHFNCLTLQWAAKQPACGTEYKEAPGMRFAHLLVISVETGASGEADQFRRGHRSD